MTTTPYLGVPFISSQQAQPEVTHNTAVIMLQALALGAQALQDAPPGSPADGDTYIVGDAPTGLWAGQANKIAIFLGGWVFIPGLDSDGAEIDMGDDQVGLSVWLQSEGAFYVWLGGSAGWAAESGSPGSFLTKAANLGDLANKATARTNLGVAIGADVDAFGAAAAAQAAAEGYADGGDAATLASAEAFSADAAHLTTGTIPNARITALPFANLAALTAGSIFFGDATGHITEDNAHLFWDDINFRLGIGTTTPGGVSTGSLDVRDTTGIGGATVSSGSSLVVLRASATAGTGPAMSFERCGGASLLAPSVVLTNYIVANFRGFAHDGTAYRTCGQLTYTVTEAVPSPTAMGTRFSIFVTPTGAATVSEIIRGDHAGGLQAFGANKFLTENRALRLRGLTLSAAQALSNLGQGDMFYATNVGGNGVIIHDGTTFRRAQETGTTSRATDAAFTLTPLVDAPNQFCTGTLTADRAVTLSTTNVYDGAMFEITRTGGVSIFNYTVIYGAAGGSSKNIAKDTWAKFVYDATAAFWRLAAAASL